MDHERQLSIISKAWGKQKGYCFFPWIDGTAKDRSERIKGYHEGPAFMWPRDKEKILEHIASHTTDDLYWCPSLFERNRRQTELAMDEHALWADLDEVDPTTIDDYPPTIAWETSPGRYQALWLISGGDVQGASWRGGENHRLTTYLGADQSGWDTTQLLRIPGWINHKPDYRQKGKSPEGKLLWATGRRYLPDEFDDLPAVDADSATVTTLLEDQLKHIDRHEVWDRVRLEVSKEVRELVAAREAQGDRSDKLWQIERDLADAGCTIGEIVSVVRETVWNKFQGRGDELKRLTNEAAKAIEAIPADVGERLEQEHEEKPAPTLFTALIKDVKPPKWLIKDILTEGACGFIAGQPKQYKSWVALDMALSVATGIDFLNHFPVLQPGPVLYIQEEDPLPTLKGRFEKIWPGKEADRMVVGPGGSVEWVPGRDLPREPDLMASVGEGFTISSPGWQAWLDESLEAGFPVRWGANGEVTETVRYRLVVMDPLMMIAGDVEENKAQAMTEKVFKPIKQLARKHDVAVQIVHHMRKSDPNKPVRGGQLMLGSVANHAWAEDSLYLRTGRGGDLIVEAESKFAPGGDFKVSRIRNRSWTPVVVEDRVNEELEGEEREQEADALGSPVETSRNGQVTKKRSPKGEKPRGRPPATKDNMTSNKTYLAMQKLGPGPHRITDIAKEAGLQYQTVNRQLQRLHGVMLAEKAGTGQWQLI